MYDRVGNTNTMVIGSLSCVFEEVFCPILKTIAAGRCSYFTREFIEVVDSTIPYITLTELQVYVQGSSHAVNTGSGVNVMHFINKAIHIVDSN